MEKRLKRIEVILVFVVLISFVNLAISFSNGSDENTIESTEEIVEQKPLPVDIDKATTNKIVYKIKNDFNDNNWDGFYEVFSEYATAIIEPETIKTEFLKLSKVTGKIGTYAYSHYKYLGYEDGAEWFKVFYKCRFDNGKGRIELQVRNVDEISEITGVNINIEEL